MADTVVNSSSFPDFSENIKSAQKIYESLGDSFVELNAGKYISVEPVSGEHFIGDTKEESVELSNKKLGNKIVFTRKIGELEKVATHYSMQQDRNRYASIF